MASSSAKLIQLAAPLPDESQLTTREKLILWRSSKLHGCAFPPWQGPPSAEEFRGEWQDATEFRLSPEQLDAFDGWKSPEKNLAQLKGFQSTQVDLVQDITSDCSVVASLCALTARAEKLGPQHEHILAPVLYPSDGNSANGKYVLKLHFNGCFRKVTIDDRLPTSKVVRSLHCFDRRDPGNLGPALVEKAYLKVRGGYDFLGSNSGTDLWVLTGWIPEQLFLQSEDVVPHAFWKRIFNAFNYGDVLITLGTHKLTRKEEQLLGLTGEHAYAIIDMKEKENRHLFLIKNPWSKGGTWTGFVDPSNPGTRSQPEPDDSMPPGTFWMDLHNVISYFHTIYLNWNPGLFRYRRDVHFSWNLSTTVVPASFANNPQYTMRCEEGSTVFLVLTKHFEDIGIEDAETEQGYIGLYAYEASHRVLLRKRPLFKSNYLDAPNVLLRFDLPAKTDFTIVVGEQDLPSSELNFSLSAFSLKPLSKFSLAPEKYPHVTEAAGSWTVATAGGAASSQMYHKNPQFSLTVPSPSDIAIFLETTHGNLAVHVKLVWAGGKRIPPAIMSSDVYGDSGEYTPGCALAELCQVVPGIYTIVCSTFEQGQVGSFNLQVRSTSPQCRLQPVPREEAGMLVTRLPEAPLRQGVDRLLAPLTVTSNSRLRFVARNSVAEGGKPNSPIKLSIEFGQGPNKRVLLSSGDFSFHSEVRSSDIDITSSMTTMSGPGVWLVIERASGSHVEGNENIRIEMLSNMPGAGVGPWGRESNVPIEELRKSLGRTSMGSLGH